MDTQTFVPLQEAKPHLKHLVDLVQMNGSVINKINQNSSLTPEDVCSLEAITGQILTRSKSLVSSPKHQRIRETYESIAKIHMLWSV